jgi:hypothetical protein
LPAAEAWGRNQCNLFDRVCIINTGGQSGTRRVFELLRAEGLPIEIFDWPRFASGEMHWQGHDKLLKWGQVTALANSERQPDWVAFTDGDELPQFKTRADFHAALATVPPGHAAALTLAQYLPTPNGMRRQLAPQDQVKALAPWGQGVCWPLVSGHRARWNDQQGEMPWVRIGTYAHVPIQSAAQAVVKYCQGYGVYSPDTMRAVKHAPTEEQTREFAVAYYHGGAEVDDAGGSPFDGIEIKYPEYQKVDVIEPLAQLAGLTRDEAVRRYGDDVNALAEAGYGHYEKCRKWLYGAV